MSNTTENFKLETAQLKSSYTVYDHEYQSAVVGNE